MELSDQGLAFIKRREGLRLRCYNDSAGFATIGYGHLIRRGPCDASVDTTTTEEQAGVWLRLDAQTAERAVNELVTVPLGQAQFDALVSFVFNVGVGAFKGSTLLKRLNRGDYHSVGEQLKRWAFAGGRVIAGLVDRRARERMLFDSAFYGEN